MVIILLAIAKCSDIHGPGVPVATPKERFENCVDSNIKPLEELEKKSQDAFISEYNRIYGNCAEVHLGKRIDPRH